MLTTASSVDIIPLQPKPQLGFVRLSYSLLDSSTGQSLSAVQRALYVDMARKFNGRNNGNIPYSVRDAESALRITRRTALRALHTLQDKNLIICHQRGSFDLKTRKAKISEWELPAMVTPGHPAKVTLGHPAADTRAPKTLDIDKKEGGLPREAREEKKDSVWIKYDTPEWDLIERFGYRATGKVFFRFGRLDGDWFLKSDVTAIKALANGGGP